LEPSSEHPHTPGPSLWPVGFAVGVIVALVGIAVGWFLVAVGAAIAIVFALLWVRDAAGAGGLTRAPEVEAERRDGGRREPAPPPPTDPAERFPRSVFLEASTLGLGAAIGALVTLPALGFMIGPSFLKQGVRDHDLGPISNYPEGEFIVATFMSQPDQGTVSRRTAFVRYNGPLGKVPSYTVISNHCAHLGCPVQPNGETFPARAKHYQDVRLVPSKPSGFGCPCHGGQYDTEGNRTAGPPVRALDRYSFSIRNQHLFLGKPFSVSHVTGSGATALIHKWTYSFPGEWVNGIESWLYPVQPPH
jgi:quinol---cytochrome c reductase iron-sulfur subunit, bacillus type